VSLQFIRRNSEVIGSLRTFILGVRWEVDTKSGTVISVRAKEDVSAKHDLTTPFRN